MAEANRGLTAHYFLNFSVIGDGAVTSKSPPRRGFRNTWNRLAYARQFQETVLHIDVTSSAITTVDRERETTVAKIDDVLDVSSLPGQSMHLVLALLEGHEAKFQFQTNHDAIIFQTTLLQLMHGGHIAQLPHPRQLLKRGLILKRGRSGRFSERFAVLVPARMFVMRSREAKFPQDVLSLVSTKLTFFADSRTIALPVAGKTYTFRGITDDDASDWVRRLEGSIGLRYNPYKYSKLAATADDGAIDVVQPPEPGAEGLSSQPHSPLAAPGEPATIWHANEAVEDLADERPDPTQPMQIPDAPLGTSDDGSNQSVSQLAEESEETDWQQVADATWDADSRPARARGVGGGGSRHSDDRPVGRHSMGDAATSDSGHSGTGDDCQAAVVCRDSDGATFEDTREEAFSADGSLAGENARLWDAAPAKRSVVLGTMTEPLGGTRSDDVLKAAEEAAAAAIRYPQPAGAAAPAQQPRRPTYDDAAALPLQEHIGAVLSRVRSLMSDVSTFQTQQAALTAATDAGDMPLADADAKERRGSVSKAKQPDRIAAVRSEYQDGTAARALLQQWQARQMGSQDGHGMPTTFTPTQAAQVQELLQELALLSAEAGHSTGQPDQHLAIDLGGGIHLRLLPNMRIVIEMDGSSAAGAPPRQPLMTVDTCAQIAQASIAAAQAAHAAVRDHPQHCSRDDSGAYCVSQHVRS